MAQQSASKNQASSYHHGDLKYALVEAAKKLLKENGPEGLTLRETARVVGVSHAAPYRHFADKQALLADVATGGFYELKESVRSVLEHAPGDKLFEMGMAYVLFALQNPHLYRLMFGRVFRDKDPHPQLEQAAEDTFAELEEVIFVGQEGKLFKEGDPRELGTIVWALVHGMANLIIDGQVAPDNPIHLGESLAGFVRDALAP
jgi:AcrR family transcriptional regulator